MDYVGWLTTVAGLAIISVVLMDAFLAILHQDRSGIILGKVHRFIWNALLPWSPSGTQRRRYVISLAGPIMMLVTFLLWLGLLILGFALLIFPHLSEGYRAESELVPQALTFIDALYYSGITATVLGYGDITPLTSTMKFIAFVESGLGFGLLTAIVTYLLQVANGASGRNALSVRLGSDCSELGDGSKATARLFKESPESIQYFFESLLVQQQQVGEMMHQFPILDIYHRSVLRSRDPELIFLTLCEYSITLRLFAGTQEGKDFTYMADRYEFSISNFLEVISKEHFSSTPAPGLMPNAKSGIELSLKMFLRSLKGFASKEPDLQSLNNARSQIGNARLFLLQLDEITRWRKEHVDRVSPLFVSI